MSVYEKERESEKERERERKGERKREAANLDTLGSEGKREKRKCTLARFMFST